MKKVVIIGIQGLPARYGGFETMVENILGDNTSNDVEYTVFCSSKDMPKRLQEYKGAHLKYVGLHANGVQSILYDIVSMIRSVRGFDAILVLGVSGCLFLPIFRLIYRKKLIVNIDGLEHRRNKWGKWAKRILRWSEAMAVKYADVVVADNKGIQDYVADVYGKQAEMIAYGGDNVIRDIPQSKNAEVLEKYNLEKDAYSIAICRIEPENNCHIILEAFAKKGSRLVMIGNWHHSAYSKELRNKYGDCNNITFIDSLYDLDDLYVLRSNARFYIHGHSAGGTNPSLVEAMFFARPVFCFDVNYNRATTCEKAWYWENAETLQHLLDCENLSGAQLKEIASEKYTWKHITEQYESLF